VHPLMDPGEPAVLTIETPAYRLHTAPRVIPLSLSGKALATLLTPLYALAVVAVWLAARAFAR
jgi:hypothetical protein